MNAPEPRTSVSTDTSSAPSSARTSVSTDTSSAPSASIAASSAAAVSVSTDGSSSGRRWHQVAFPWGQP